MEVTTGDAEAAPSTSFQIKERKTHVLFTTVLKLAAF